MKIAQIANVAVRVPPEKYGGTERVVHALTEELVKRGHEVTLFASGDSTTSARLISVVPKSIQAANLPDLWGSNPWSMLNIGLAYEMQDQFDIIHDHHFEISTPTANLSHTPVVMTLHSVINDNNKQLFQELDNINYVTISKAQAKPAPSLNYAGNVYHGLAMDNFPFSNQPGKYLLFVGRISEEKGVHFAIKTAQALKLPLIIAAKLNKGAGPDEEYFHKQVKPYLSSRIKWVGEVNDRQKTELMSKALVCLHPVTWPEPFGLTMIESMACGCPVIGFDQGSIPEVIRNGKSGFVVKNLSQMIKAVKNVSSINRAACRAYALSKFSVKNMADGYEAIYKQVLAKKYYQETLTQ